MCYKSSSIDAEMHSTHYTTCMSTKDVDDNMYMSVLNHASECCFCSVRHYSKSVQSKVDNILVSKYDACYANLIN